MEEAGAGRLPATAAPPGARWISSRHRQFEWVPTPRRRSPGVGRAGEVPRPPGARKTGPSSDLGPSVGRRCPPPAHGVAGGPRE
eukprot:7116505-Alexandrium_andersonii.AAC.1